MANEEKVVFCNGDNIQEVVDQAVASGGKVRFECTLERYARDHGEKLPYCGTLEYIRRMQMHATIDRLSGLMNQSAFTDAVKERLKQRRVGDKGEASVLVIIDLDLLKKVNDSFGHAAGDMVIARIGEVIGLRVRKEDIVGRLGGDEFGIYLEGATELGAEPLIELIRNEFEATEFPFNANKSPEERTVPSFSAGMVEIPLGEGSLEYEPIAKLADGRMYADKAWRRMAR